MVLLEGNFHKELVSLPEQRHESDSRGFDRGKNAKVGTAFLEVSPPVPRKGWPALGQPDGAYAVTEITLLGHLLYEEKRITTGARLISKGVLADTVGRRVRRAFLQRLSRNPLTARSCCRLAEFRLERDPYFDFCALPRF